MRKLAMIGVMLVLIGAASALWAAGETWFRGDLVPTSTLTGQALTSGLAGALALTALVSLLLQLGFGRTGRRVLGIGIVLLALAALATAVSTRSPQVLTATSWAAARTPALWVFCVAAVVWCAGGVLVALCSQPERRSGARDRDDHAWRVLDRGADPTVD